MVKFPSPLNDVINGYLSVLNSFRTKIKSVTFLGDSAGACLIAGCVNYLIVNQLRKPDNIIFLYPALICNMNFFSPSILKSYRDEMINFFHLQTVLTLYLGIF